MTIKTKHDNVVSMTEALDLDEPKRGQYVRIQLSLKPEYAQRLGRLKKKANAGSYAEIVRDALRRHEQLEGLMGPDDKLCVEKPDGTRTYILR